MNPFHWLRYILTDERDEWDLGILLWIVGVALFLWRSWNMQTFDPQAYGIGLAGVLGAGAGMRWLRNREQDEKEKA